MKKSSRSKTRKKRRTAEKKKPKRSRNQCQETVGRNFMTKTEAGVGSRGGAHG